ncbi:MAG: hypothetical protein ACMXYB_00055 [Candidatus Woesearchaeota archaeon]
MSLLSLFSRNPKFKKYEDETKSLKIIKQHLEQYIFYIYQKVEIIVGIQNKFYDIKNAQKGYIREDEKVFKNPDKQYIFYKRWINNRLKKINKILQGEFNSSKNSITTQKKAVYLLILQLKNDFKEIESNQYIDELQNILELLERWEKNLEKQTQIFSKLYPIQNWTIELHEKLISNELLNLIKEEIRIVFNLEFTSNNYNEFLVAISRAVHTTNIEHLEVLTQLIEKKNSKIKEKKQIDTLKFELFYHARPKFTHKPLFPLDTEDKSAGFFVDSDLDETIRIVCRMYNIEVRDLEVFEITMPVNLSKFAIYDPNDFDSLKIGDIDNSWVFKPTIFPNLNDFYSKGLIKIRLITSNK